MSMVYVVPLALLNREGYSTWKFKMHNYVIHEELWEAISDYATGMNVSNDAKKRSDQMALTKICLTLNHLQLRMSDMQPLHG